MQIEVQRPQASKGKIHSKNEFELCYLRHQYLRRVRYNPTQEEMEPFMRIARHLARNTYHTYKNLFRLVGFEIEDLINITRVHLTSFLGLFSIEHTEEKYGDFLKAFNKIQDRNPEKEDILDKNKANFTLFLKQRMEEIVRICRQKARNIKGFPTEEYHYFYGPKKPPKILRKLLKNYEQLGFKKLDMAIYRSIKKKVGTIYGSTFVFAKNYYVAVPLEKKSLSEKDFSGADLDPRDNLHNMNPEDIYSTLENNKILDQKRIEFLSSSSEKRASVIRDFIRTNKKRSEYRKEIKIAKKLLKNIG